MNEYALGALLVPPPSTNPILDQLFIEELFTDDRLLITDLSTSKPKLFTSVAVCQRNSTFRSVGTPVKDTSSTGNGAAEYTHAAPTLLLSFHPPTIAVVPSDERQTEYPCCEDPIAPVPTILFPCCDQTPTERVKTHAAPTLLLSL